VAKIAEIKVQTFTFNTNHQRRPRNNRSQAPPALGNMSAGERVESERTSSAEVATSGEGFKKEFGDIGIVDS